jgi:SAM-dependent methyltransferase
MGIAKGMASLLCECKNDFPVGGKVLQLGKQNILVRSDQLSKVMAKFGLPPRPAKMSAKITDVDFFKALGFQTVESLDADSYEGADHIHDFNKPVPEEMKGQYDLVFDGGTLEHIFDFPQSLKNIFDLLKPGGIIIHASPSHNHVDHGFYMFSPTVFYDYYSVNKFEILKSYIFEHDSVHTVKDWLIYKYTPGCIEHLSIGGWGKGILGIFFAAQKVPLSTRGVTPQQGACLRDWSNALLSKSLLVQKPVSLGPKRLVKLALMLPGTRMFSNWAYALNSKLYNSYQKRMKGRPRVIARY